jgi:serine/threonine-protein kinase
VEDYTNKRIDGRYEIQELIGVGGMACVYKAFDNVDERTVAVKILKNEFLTNEEFRQRFKNESKVIAVLSHPNIVKVYDVSYGDRLQYIVMEYVEGITLKEYIRQQGRLTPGEVLHFTSQILRALQHAHDKGIVHRDIKPQNILLLANGTIKVTDFGIARFSAPGTRSVTESAIGSVHYISPEQARGEVTDDKADIYSVGVVLYEMLTGTLPFQSDNSVSVAMMQIQNDPTPLTQINPDIPLGLEQMTLHAMRKNPKERYPSAAEMILDLEELRRNPQVTFDFGYSVDDAPTKYVDGKVSKAVPTAVVAPAPEPEKPNRTAPILVGILLSVVTLALITTALYFLLGWGKVQVPHFINKDYATEIQTHEGDTYKKLSIVVVEGDNPDPIQYKVGQVFAQTPSGGTKVKKGSTVTLNIVKADDENAEKVKIPDNLVGKNLQEVTTILKDLKLEVESFPQERGTKKDVGKVLETDPKAGAEIEAGGVVKVYFSFVGDLVTVPNLLKTIPLTRQEAEDALRDAQLALGAVSYADSTAEEGRVIGQSYKAGEKIPINSPVNIVLSNGTPPATALTLKVPLPQLGGLEGKLRVYVNNERVGDVKIVRMDGATYSLPVTASGKDQRIKVTLNDITIYEATADYTSNPPKVLDSTTPIDSFPIAFLPSVVGRSQAEGVAILEGARFTKVVIDPRPTSEPSEDGLILAQSPVGGNEFNPTSYKSVSTQIKLTVGFYEEPQTVPPTTPAPPVTSVPPPTNPTAGQPVGNE